MKLLEPFELGRLRLQNRVVVSSYAAFHHLYDPGADIEWYVEHLARRSAVGMFVLQCAFPRLVGVDEPPVDLAHLTSVLHRLGGALHEGGAAAILQLSHQGTHANGMANPTVRAIQGFTAVPGEVSPEVAHEMSDQEIRALVRGFGELAQVSVEAGLDGVEIHGAHGHLVHQSIGRWGNQRSDAWGEPLAFVTAIAEEIRGRAPGLTVGLRFPSNDHRPVEEGGSTLEELKEWIGTLARSGTLDYINPTEGSSYDHYHRTIGTFRRPHGEFMGRTRVLRAAVNGAVPVIGVGRVVTVDQAEAALADGSCDLVAMTRAHLADPDLLAKLRSGQATRIRPCVGANQGCLDKAHAGAPLTCFQNPEVGRETTSRLTPLRAGTRRVLVVGAGPGGLKAAETAARSGHAVTLIDRLPRVGGRLGAITDASEAVELLKAMRWMHEEVVRLGVTVRLGTAWDDDVQRELRPDVIIAATGSVPTEPRFTTDDSVPVLTTDESIERSVVVPLGRVLVVDEMGTEEVRVTWEQLAGLGNDVVIATAHAAIGRYLGHTHGVDVVDDALRRGCRIEERTSVRHIAGGHVLTTGRLGGEELLRPFDAVVLGAHRRAAHLRDLDETGITVHTIGDAYAPRDAMTAISEGYTIGSAL